MLAFGLLAALALIGACAADSRPSAVTTAPIFLPYYDEESWSIVRGSILESNETASETTYTIFCPVQTPPVCDLSLEFPFVFVEGPGTVDFHGTVTSTYIADLGCDLDGTTAATCSGYSSYAPGFTNGPHTGPTEVSWTTTLSESEIEWGVLTMAEVPDASDDDNGLNLPNGNDGADVTIGLTDLLPMPTDSGAGAGTVSMGLFLATMLVAVLML